jgi:hypothetical protein
MKRIRTTVKNALKRGQLKVGNKVWIEAEIIEIDKTPTDLPLKTSHSWLLYDTNVLITKPEPVPIDFGAEGRVLQYKACGTIIKTTGLKHEETKSFYAYIVKSGNTKLENGYASIWSYQDESDWQDITETYNK